MTDMHNYDEKNKNTCQTCKKLYELHGDTDAQIDEPHEIVEIKEASLGKRGRETEEDDYSTPGFDIRKPDEITSSSNVRLKKAYTAKNAKMPASQLDAFELYGGKRRKRKNSKKKRKVSKRRKTLKKHRTHRRR